MRLKILDVFYQQCYSKFVSPKLLQLLKYFNKYYESKVVPICKHTVLH